MEKKESHKIKVALFFGYDGRPFHGMQKNSNSFTIEESLEKTLYELGLILKSNYGDLRKSGWNRGSRTDKGVHALANVVACKLELGEKYLRAGGQRDSPDKKRFRERLDLEKLRADINAACDRSIRVFAVFCVTKNFEVRASARSRKYEYLFPASLLDLPADARAPAQKLQQLDALLQAFVGSHSFHNYTSKGDSADKSSVRVILGVSCQPVALRTKPPAAPLSPARRVQSDAGEPAERELPEAKARPGEAESAEMDFVLVKLHGQSFIYHQIRKMVGAALFSFRNKLDKTFIENSFAKNTLNIWLAPSQGLFLDRITFDSYNKKTDIPMTLELSAQAEQEVREFKQSVILPAIAEAEAEQALFTTWLARAEGRDKTEEKEKSEED